MYYCFNLTKYEIIWLHYPKLEPIDEEAKWESQCSTNDRLSRKGGQPCKATK